MFIALLGLRGVLEHPEHPPGYAPELLGPLLVCTVLLVHMAFCVGFLGSSSPQIWELLQSADAWKASLQSFVKPSVFWQYFFYGVILWIC